MRAGATAVIVALAVLAVPAMGCRGRRGGVGRGPLDSGLPGADAALPDDAGGTGRDAGSRDAGSRDAGPRDAGSRDAGGTINLTGPWSGTWSSSGLGGLAMASLFQDGASVEGTFSLTGSPCVTSGAVSATLVGSTLTGTFSSTSDSASFTGPATSHEITASFTVDTGPCTGLAGTVDLTR